MVRKRRVVIGKVKREDVKINKLKLWVKRTVIVKVKFNSVLIKWINELCTSYR